ncbi:hypothetical protein [Ruegeria sp. HKCCE3926]|uniref:hypothetical protein n=1 Tax=Ruegeria sp. HKCCE3926 TaxID=2794831 RepID=UPI001AE42C76|nr:hypothetical protein [Ruegeria sp. HKCCE3926]
MSKQLINGKYKAVRQGNTITLFASAQVRCVDWHVKLERTTDLVSPPIHEFFLYTKKDCLEIPGVLNDSISLQFEDSDIWESVIVRDAGGEQKVPVVNFKTIIADQNAAWVTTSENYIVIANSIDESKDCRVIPEDNFFIATHKKVYGPDTLENCTVWQFKNCGK